MLLYQYPHNKSVSEKRMNKININTEKKKLKKNLLVSAFVSLLILFITFFVEVIWVIIVCIMISIYNFAVSFVAYRVFVQYSNDKIYTKVYDDRLIHYQPSFFSNKLIRYTIMFEDILKSSQDKWGNLIIYLDGNKEYEYEIINNNSTIKTEKNKNNIIILKFSDIEPKIYIINNFAKEIKYIIIK